MTWEVRTVDIEGAAPTVLQVSATQAQPGVNLAKISRRLNADESLTLVVPTLHANSAELELFEREVQVWRTGTPEALTAGGEPVTVNGDPITVDLDRSLYGWFRPGRWRGDPKDRTVECPGLFDHFFDEVVGGIRPNHVTPPHEDTALIGAAPNAWTVTGGVEDAAMVDNNAEFWQYPKAIQLNNGEAGTDAYAYVRVPVPAELVGVPFAASAVAYVADNQGGAPAYVGAAYENRGLMIQRLDATTAKPLAKPQVAQITDETERNKPVRLQTPEVIPASTSEVIEVRIYAPAAWTVWRWVKLDDGRALKVDRSDKSVAVEALVDHAQDTGLGKQYRNIEVDAVNLGETISIDWPWWRRDNIGEKLLDLADTFELEMAVTATTRSLRVRPQVGTDRTATVTLTKADFTDWSATADRRASGSRVIMQGEGSGVARDEVWVEDGTAINGHTLERLEFAPPGSWLQALWDSSTEMMDRIRKVTVLPTATIAGDLALEVRPGDTVAVNLSHGNISYVGNARITAVDLTPAARTAALTLEPLT